MRVDIESLEANKHCWDDVVSRLKSGERPAWGIFQQLVLKPGGHKEFEGIFKQMKMEWKRRAREILRGMLKVAMATSNRIRVSMYSHRRNGAGKVDGGGGNGSGKQEQLSQFRSLSYTLMRRLYWVEQRLSSESESDD